MDTYAALCAKIGAALSEACEAPDSELTVGVLVSHLVDTSISVQDIQSKLDNFLRDVPERAMTASLLDWFGRKGFADNSVATVTSSHSSLAFLLDTRCGLPIAHALLLIAAARRAGLTSFGLNFPGHFLVDSSHHRVRFNQYVAQMIQETGGVLCFVHDCAVAGLEIRPMCMSVDDDWTFRRRA